MHRQCVAASNSFEGEGAPIAASFAASGLFHSSPRLFFALLPIFRFFSLVGAIVELAAALGVTRHALANGRKWPGAPKPAANDLKEAMT